MEHASIVPRDAFLSSWSRLYLGESMRLLQMTKNRCTRGLSGPVPLISEIGDYAHVRADGTLSRCSYSGNGVQLRGRSVEEALSELAQFGPIAVIR